MIIYYLSIVINESKLKKKRARDPSLKTSSFCAARAKKEKVFRFAIKKNSLFYHLKKTHQIK